jgi:integrase
MAEPIEQHIDAYLATLAGSEMHRQNTGTYLRTLAQACGRNSLEDMKRADLETWLAAESKISSDKPKRSARSRNAYQTALVSSCNWCVGSAKAMPENPFARMPKASLEADPRRTRRALTVEEMRRRLEAARTAPERPPSRSKRKPGTTPRRPEVKLSGPQRAELYIVLLGTGLRVGELAKLKVRDIRLDTRVPGIDLPEKVG